jgi:hypothetical protein
LCWRRLRGHRQFVRNGLTMSVPEEVLSSNSSIKSIGDLSAQFEQGFDRTVVLADRYLGPIGRDEANALT